MVQYNSITPCPNQMRHRNVIKVSFPCFVLTIHNSDTQLATMDYILDTASISETSQLEQLYTN